MAIGPYQAVDCSAISEVPRIDGLNDLNDNGTLILVSVPYNGIDDDHSTSEDYISKSATLGELSEHLRDSLELYHIYEMLDGKVDLSILNYSATIQADTINPYILSSLTIKDGKFDHANGYRLSAGIDQVFANDRASDNKLRTEIMDSWTGNRELSNRFMYTIAYDHEYNRIDLHNTNNSSHSYIYRDDMLSDWFDDIKRYNLLSNVTMSRDGTKLYLHFVLSSGNDPSRPSLKKVTIDFKHVFPYEYLSSQGGLSVMYPGVDAEGEALGKLSVMVDTNVISTKKYVNDQDYALSGLLSTYTNTRINELCGYVDAQDQALSNALSTYTNRRITELSNTLSTYTNTRINELSNTLSTYTNRRITELSNTLSTYTNRRITELSNTLSTYTNSRINELCGYVDAQDTKILNLSKTYTNSKITELSNTLSTYTNSRINELCVYVNAQDQALSNTLSTYTNTKINELCGYVDTQDTKILNLSKTYTNQEINSLSSYVNSQDQALSNTLSTYTNTQINNLRSYVNQQLTAINNSITNINTRLSNIEQRLSQGYYIEVEQ